MGRGGRLDVRGWANQSLHLTRRLVLDFKLITSSAAVQVTSNRFVGQEQPLSMHEIGIVEADLNDPRHQSAVLCMMDAYSADPMGDAKPLSDFARLNLISGLRTHPTTLVFLAFRGDQPCGIATCFRGFSTFAAKPLINISDFFVDPVLRGQGIGRLLLEAILEEAKRTDCCKLTLEVQQNNSVARSIYGKFGFKQAVYAADAEGGGSLFMVKSI